MPPPLSALPHRDPTAAPPFSPPSTMTCRRSRQQMASALAALKWALAVTPSSAEGPRGAGGHGDDGAPPGPTATHEQLLREAEAIVDMNEPLVPQIGKLTKAQVGRRPPVVQ